MGALNLTLHTTPAPSLNFIVVEDGTVASIELECILEDLGHRVAAVAVSPGFAQKALRMHDIDAVIFGATLVGLPPYALMDALSRQGIPAAVSSVHPEEFVRVLGFEVPYLAKPYKFDDVARVVAELQGGKVATAA